MLVVADQQCSAFRQPGQGSLHYPPAGLSSSGPALRATILTDRPDVGHVAMSFGCIMPSRVVIPSVEAQILLKLLGVGAFDDDCLDRCLEQFLIHYVGSGDHHPEWPPITLDQYRLLGAVLGVLAGAQNQPPRGASKPATCEEKQIRQVGFRGTLLSLEPHHVELPQSGHDRPRSVPSS